MAVQPATDKKQQRGNNSNNNNSNNNREALIAELKAMDIQEAVIREVLNKNKNITTAAEAIHAIFNPPSDSKDGSNDDLQKAIKASLQDEQKSIPAGANSEDAQLNKAIEASIKESNIDPSMVDPDNPHRRKREEGVPVGLKNMGNICYFNSLLQVCFRFRPELFEAILTLPSHLEVKHPDDNVRKSLERAVKFVQQWKKLYAQLFLSKHRFIDPKSCVDALFAYSGDSTEIAAQHDVVEWFRVIVQAIEEVFGAVDHQPQLIQRLFYSKFSQHSNATDKEGKAVMQTVKKTEKNIILSITTGDIHSAIEEYVTSTIDDYKLDGGEITTAQQESWFESVPDILCFQLRRVDFDREKKEPIKIHSKFHFGKDLYMSRYHIDNKERTTKIRKEFHELAAQRNSLLQQLKSITDFAVEQGGETVNLSMCLKAVVKFLTSDNTSLCDSLIENKDDKQTVEIKDWLSIVEGKLNQHVVALKAKVEELTNKMQQLYQAEEMMRNKYTLHSVFVHEGRFPAQGHFWAYVRQRRNVKDPNVENAPTMDTWLQYNDARVLEVEDQKVWLESLGGETGLHASAYFLVYVRDDVAENKDASQRSFHQLDLSVDEEKQYECAIVEKFIPGDLSAEVIADNVKLEDEIKQWDKKQTQKVVETASNQIVQDFMSEHKGFDKEAEAFKSIKENARLTEFASDPRLKGLSEFIHCLSVTQHEERFAKVVRASKYLRKIAKRKDFNEHYNDILRTAQTSLLNKGELAVGPLVNTAVKFTDVLEADEKGEIVGPEIELNNVERDELKAYVQAYRLFVEVTDAELAGMKHMIEERLWLALKCLLSAYDNEVKNGKQTYRRAWKREQLLLLIRICLSALYEKTKSQLLVLAASDGNDEKKNETFFQLKVLYAIAVISTNLFEESTDGYANSLCHDWIAVCEAMQDKLPFAEDELAMITSTFTCAREGEEVSVATADILSLEWLPTPIKENMAVQQQVLADQGSSSVNPLSLFEQFQSLFTAVVDQFGKTIATLTLKAIKLV